jgi:hypothetical protein
MGTQRGGVMAEAKEFIEPELVKYEETLADITAGITGYPDTT